MPSPFCFYLLLNIESLRISIKCWFYNELKDNSGFQKSLYYGGKINLINASFAILSVQLTGLKHSLFSGLRCSQHSHPTVSITYCHSVLIERQRQMAFSSSALVSIHFLPLSSWLRKVLQLCEIIEYLFFLWLDFNYHKVFKIYPRWTREMAHWMTVPAIKSNDLSSIPSTNMMEGEKWLCMCVSHMQMYAHTHTHCTHNRAAICT